MRKTVLAGIAAALPLVGPAASGAASSIVAVAPPQETPSIVSMGEAAPAPIEATPVAEADGNGTEILAIGNSMVAIGADAIPPSREEVSATGAPAAPDWLAADAPLPLRGGGER